MSTPPPISSPPESAGAQLPRPTEVSAEALYEGRRVGWLESCGAYLASMVVHLVLFVALALLLGDMPRVVSSYYDPPHFESSIVNETDSEMSLDPYDLTTPPDFEPSVIDVTVTEPVARPDIPEELQGDDGGSDESAAFAAEGGGTPGAPTPNNFGGLGTDFSVDRVGIALHGHGGIGRGAGRGAWAGNGGDGNGFSDRGTGDRGAKAGRRGGTKASEQAVNAALNWLARHQAKDGSWSVDKFTRQCRNGFCGGHTQLQADSAATALGLLPFLAAGETHIKKCMYQETVRKGLAWLMRNQDTTTGNLAGKTTHVMYSHGLATIALCEAYGMTEESRLGYAAQAAIDFIVKTQNKQGGWRYIPGDFDADTSVVGWQLMALKSAQMAGLQVPQSAFGGVGEYLGKVASGHYGGQYCYREGQGATPSMTSVGLLCRQYMGDGPESPRLREGTEYLMQHLPNVKNARDTYYWYYATQVMHNMSNADWDQWNRRMRRTLIETQVQGRGCATGSWDPEKPIDDAWGAQGGRLMMTSLSCLTLEVYYRYLPLYDIK